MSIVRVVCWVILALAQLLACPAALAHGSVVAQGDLCVIRIGYFSAHFKIFQPQNSQETEFCEDLPARGESIFVMEYLHQELARVPIEFRIIRDVTGMGRFAQLEDVQKIRDLDAATVFLQKPVIKADVFSILHVFEEEGDYLGLVSAHDADNAQDYSAVFPFHVGPRSWGFLPLFGVLLVLAQTGYWLSTGGWQRWQSRKRSAVQFSKGHTRMPQTCMKLLLLLPVFLLMGAAAAPAAQMQFISSTSGKYRVSYHSQTSPVPLNEMHSWVIHLETAGGVTVDNAALEIKGGMPAHNHGLATVPVISAMGAGDYLVEGIRFHMQGSWELYLAIRHGSNTDTLVIPLEI